MRNIGLLVAACSIILVAGCVGDPFRSLFGGPGEVREASPDIILVQNENIVPAPPILAGDEVTVSFEVKNADDINSVSDVSALLYDWGLCNTTKISGADWTLINGMYNHTLGKMAPGQSKPLDFTLIAPTRDQLGNLPGKCPVRYKVNYTFTASTSTSAEVINSDKLHELQATGQTPTFAPTTDLGRGPIKIYMGTVGTLPARTDSTLYLSLYVQNKGTGTYLRVPANSLLVKVPKAWTLQGDCGGEIEEKAEEGEYRLFRNKNDIDLVGAEKKTFELRCGFTMPTDIVVPETKTYFLFSNLTYSYDLINELDIDITP